MATVGNDVIKTGVDQLVSYLQGREKTQLSDVAKVLGVEMVTLQSWVDFLVEEGVLGIEYKFTRPYIYLNKEAKDTVRTIGHEELTWNSYHKAFLEKAREKEISDVQAAALWKTHVLSLLDKKESFFFDEARKRGMTNLENLWKEYKTDVLLKI